MKNEANDKMTDYSYSKLKQNGNILTVFFIIATIVQSYYAIYNENYDFCLSFKNQVRLLVRYPKQKNFMIH